MTATLDIGDDRSTLRFERTLAHPRDRVWRAVTEPGELEQWFPSAVVYEPRVGASMQFDFGGKQGVDVLPGEVLEWDPPRVFAFAWGEDVLRFELSDADAGTRLVFTHSFAHEPGKPARDAGGWAACFDAFDAHLAGDPDPAMGNWSAHHEAHLALFGDLTLEGDDGSRVVRLRGPSKEVDGRAAVDVTVDGDPGVMLVREADAALEDGADVEVRPEDGGDPVLASGVLRDPLAGRAPATLGA